MIPYINGKAVGCSPILVLRAEKAEIVGTDRVRNRRVKGHVHLEMRKREKSDKDRDEKKKLLLHARLDINKRDSRDKDVKATDG